MAEMAEIMPPQNWLRTTQNCLVLNRNFVENFCGHIFCLIGSTFNIVSFLFASRLVYLNIKFNKSEI